MPLHMCICLYCTISSLVLLTSNKLWAHYASEVPRNLITLRLRSGILKGWCFEKILTCNPYVLIPMFLIIFFFINLINDSKYPTPLINSVIQLFSPHVSFYILPLTQLPFITTIPSSYI